MSAAVQPIKRKPGRPPKDQSGEPKRAFFQTRIRESLKQRLEASASEDGRSLSEEIEHRLECSYGRVEDQFGGRIGLSTAIMLFAGFRHAGDLAAAGAGHPEWTIAEWLRDTACSEQALRQLVLSVWNALHPEQPYQGIEFRRWLDGMFQHSVSLELSLAAMNSGESLTPEQQAREREAIEALAASAEQQQQPDSTPAPQPTRQRRSTRRKPAEASSP